MNFETNNMNSNGKNNICYMNHQESSVRSYLKTDFNRSLMNRSLFATSLKNWFVTGLATFVLVLASGLDAFAQTVTLT